MVRCAHTLYAGHAAVLRPEDFSPPTEPQVAPEPGKDVERKCVPCCNLTLPCCKQNVHLALFNPFLLPAPSFEHTTSSLVFVHVVHVVFQIYVVFKQDA